MTTSSLTRCAFLHPSSSISHTFIPSSTLSDAPFPVDIIQRAPAHSGSREQFFVRSVFQLLRPRRRRVLRGKHTQLSIDSPCALCFPQEASHHPKNPFTNRYCYHHFYLPLLYDPYRIHTTALRDSICHSTDLPYPTISRPFLPWSYSISPH